MSVKGLWRCLQVKRFAKLVQDVYKRQAVARVIITSFTPASMAASAFSNLGIIDVYKRQVMNGRGEFVVTAVGDATEIGKVAKKSTEQTSVETPPVSYTHLPMQPLGA